MVSILLFLFLLISNGGSEPLIEDLNPEDLHNWVRATELLYHSEIWISYGPQKPGDEVMVDWPQPENGTYYYKLIRIDDEPETIYEETREMKKINNETIADWTVTLPDELPAKNRFGVAIEQNSNTTFFVQTILVDEIHAEMWLDREEYGLSEILVMTIRNNGITRITIEEGYRFEEYQDGIWKNVPFKMAVILQDRALLPNDEFADKLVQRPAFKRGKYRVLRKVSIERTSGFLYSEVLIAEFIVRLNLEHAIIRVLVVIMALFIARKILIRYLQFHTK